MSSCRHPDIQKFDGLRCCLSCGEAVFDAVFSTEQGVDTSNSSGYQYQRLNYKLGLEIRLVVLYPGYESDDLVCDIIHSNLLDKPAYEAVSYTWATLAGDASLSAHVSCRGKKIAVTKNCESMLRAMRRQGTNRMIWVDAICIDQENAEEKNHQVRLMATIYSNASQVVAYLGPTSQETSGSINRVMDHLEGNFAAMVNRTDVQNSVDITAFLRMPYFDRVWVLQEIALAKLVTLIAGDRSTRWTADTVSILLALCKSCGIQPPSVLRWLPATQPDSDDLLDVLCRSRNCSASNPRDKVYALLGLVKQKISDAISVDYSSPPADIFINMAVHLIKDYGRFDVLLHAQYQNVDHQFFPSWVPLWDEKYYYDLLPPQFTPAQVDTLAKTWFDRVSVTNTSIHLTEKQRQKQHDDYAGTEFRFGFTGRDSDVWSPLPSHAFSPRLPCLRIRAQFLDTIMQRIPPIPLPRKRAFLDTDTHRHAMINEHRLPILPRELPDAFCGLDPCSECVLKGHQRMDSATSKLYHKLMERRLPEGPTDPSPMDLQRIAFMEDMRRFGADKTPFVTQSSLGFAHWPENNGITLGDTIWALPGLAVPVVLRKEESHYVLVSECYLFRAAQPFPCVHCGADAKPWSLATAIIDIW